MQVRSYAVQLRARYAAVMSKEAVWVWEEKDDFTDIIFSGTWDKLKKADTFSELFKIIGKK